jgi:hypothetical protein
MGRTLMLVSEVIDRTFANWLFPSGINRPSFDILNEDLDTSETDITLEGRITVPNDSILEIGSELVLTKSVVVATHVVTANERGYLDTAAATHTTGDKVYLDPMFSRKLVFDAIVTLMGDLYPSGLYQRVLDSTTLDFSTVAALALPTGTLSVLKASVAVVSGSGTKYRRLRPERGEYEVMYEFSPPKIQFLRGGTTDADVTLVLAKDFVLPTVETNDMTTFCGVSSSLVPHLPMGVAGTILQSRELPRVMIDEIRRLLASQGIQVGAAMNVGQFLLNLFKEKVANERVRLDQLDPSTFTLTR